MPTLVGAEVFRTGAARQHTLAASMASFVAPFQWLGQTLTTSHTEPVTVTPAPGGRIRPPPCRARARSRHAGHCHRDHVRVTGRATAVFKLAAAWPLERPPAGPGTGRAGPPPCELCHRQLSVTSHRDGHRARAAGHKSQALTAAACATRAVWHDLAPGPELPSQAAAGGGRGPGPRAGKPLPGRRARSPSAA